MKILFKIFFFFSFVQLQAQIYYFNSFEKAQNFAEKKIYKLKKRGFLLADYQIVDTLYNFQLFIDKKSKILLGALILENLDQNISLPLAVNKTVNFELIDKSCSQILEFYNNHGYPFAKVFLDTFFIENDFFFCKAVLAKNNRFFFNSLIINNKKYKSELFIRFLDLSGNEPFSKNKIEKIPQKINSLQFVELQKYELEFFNDSLFDIFLFLKKSKANLFSGGLAFFTDENKKLRLLGNVDFKFVNIFNRMETILIQWANTNNLSQKMFFSVDFPYLFFSNFGFLGYLNFYKQDTTFVKVEINFSLDYYLEALNKLSLFYLWKRNIALTEKNFIKNSTSNFLGVAFSYSNLDFFYNPSRGLRFFLSSAYGYKIADTLQTDAEFYLKFENFLPLFKKWVFYNQLKINVLKFKDLAQNDLLRLGGYDSFYGLDQDQFYCSEYFVGLSGVKFNFSKYSNFHFFVNYGIAKVFESSLFSNKKLISIGVGSQLKLKNGILVLDFATLIKNNTFNLEDFKIHFGLKTFF